jgi:hypothetical protein
MLKDVAPGPDQRTGGDPQNVNGSSLVETGVVSSRLMLGEVLDVLGRVDGEHVAICHKVCGGTFSSAVVESINASALVTSLPDRADVWFSVNPTAGPARASAGRGKERQVTRWAALYLDVDVKQGAFTDLDKAAEFVSVVSEMVGTRPSLVISSGHGLQPVWPIEDGELDDEVKWARAYRLSRRFGRMAASVAASHSGAALDNVSDLARVLRVANTTNWKDPEHPAEAFAMPDVGRPLTVDGVEEFLDEWAAQEIDSDSPVAEEILSPHEGWKFGTGDCRYVIEMVVPWQQETDKPRAGRHQWAMNRCLRLAAAYRLGCITEGGLLAALDYLEEALARWCREVGVPRALHHDEVGSAFLWAKNKVSAFTEERTREELGNHNHTPQSAAREPQSGQKNGRQITWRTAAEISDRCPEWAWSYRGGGRLMRSTLVLFAGRPEAGKSTAARWFAAGYTNGTIGGCFYRQPQNVAYIATEESLECMVKPSLRAVQADMSRVYFPEVQMDGHRVRLLSDLDEDALTAELRDRGITIVIVDPLMSAIASATNINKNNETRSYIEPWARIAETINGLTIGIVHLIKAPGGDIVAAINGSSAFGEVARAVIAFARDPQSDDDECVLSQEKNNAGRRDLALKYTVESATVTTDDLLPAEVGRFVIGDPSDRRVADVIHASSAEDRLGGRSVEVLEVVRQAAVPVDAKTVAACTDMSNDDAGKYLRRLAKNGLLTKVGRGLYGQPTEVRG